MHGFIAVDKPVGPTSTKTSYQIRNSFRQKVVAGHIGTLDPLASGVLVIAINAATKFSQFLSTKKTYIVDLQLGITTTSYDTEGEVVTRKQVTKQHLDHLATVVKDFEGKIKQQAPIYSALKYKGKPLYKYAREGKTVPPKVREVQIDSIKLLSSNEDGEVKLQVECSTGTYIRSLVYDIGQQLDCGAVMTALRRTQNNGIDIADTKELEKVIDNPEKCLLPISNFLNHLLEFRINAEEQQKLYYGQQLELMESINTKWVRLMGVTNEFIGVGCIDESNNLLKVAKLLPKKQ